MFPFLGIKKPGGGIWQGKEKTESGERLPLINK